MNPKLIVEEQKEVDEAQAVVEQALAVAEEKAAAVMTPEPKALTIAANNKSQIEGMEGLDASDYSIPRVKLIQAMTKDDIPDKLKHVGEWFNTIDGTVMPAPEVILLKVGRTRVMFEKGDFSGVALCRSSDGRVPVKQFEGVYSDICETCPMSKWGEDGEKPACQQGYTYLGVDPNNDMMPFMMTWASTANRVARQLNTKLRGVGRKSGRMYGSVVTLGARQIRDSRGEWYVPTYAVAPIKDAAMIAELQELFQAYAYIELEADEAVAESAESVAGDDGEAAPF